MVTYQHIAAKGGSKLSLNLEFKHKYSQIASCKVKAMLI